MLMLCAQKQLFSAAAAAPAKEMVKLAAEITSPAPILIPFSFNFRPPVEYGHPASHSPVSYSPDGTCIIISVAGKAEIFDMKTYKHIVTINDPECNILKAVFSNDGKHIITISAVNTDGRQINIKTRNFATGECEKTVTFKATFGFAFAFSCVDYSQSKQKIIVKQHGRCAVELFDAETGTDEGKFDGDYEESYFFCYNQDGTQFLDFALEAMGKTDASKGTDIYHTSWELLDQELGESRPGPKDPEIRPNMPANHYVSAATYSPDGQYIAVARGKRSRDIFGPLSAFIKIFDNEANKCIQILVGHTDTILSVAFSPDNQHIATASEDKTVKIWDIATGKCIRTLSGHAEAVQYVIYSPDGAHLSSFSQDGIRIWEDANKPALPLPAVENPQPLVDKVMAALSETNKETLLNLAAEVQDYPDLAARVTELIQRVLNS